ncbi:MAG: MFS transporter [Pseudonocardiaceae bacterium]
MESVRTDATGGEPLARLAAATTAGTAVEYYDFYVYASVAALVFGPLFFPGLSSTAGTLAAVATVAAAFVARPVGGVLFGHFGDRFGRKTTLVGSLVAMGVATVLVGLVPGYAVIGIAAPLVLVLLRFVQGLAVGGEWAGAVLLATEHAPAHQRGRYASYPIFGVAAGFLLGNGILLVLANLLSDAAFRSWGWRVPFLASVVLVVIGLYARVSLGETPAFRELAARGATARVPVGELLRHRAGTVLLGVGATTVGFLMIFLVATYGLAYGTGHLHLPRTTMISLAMISYGVAAVPLPLIGTASDRWGRRRVCLMAGGLAAGWAYPFVWLLATASPVLVAVAFIVTVAIGFLLLVTMGAYLPELFGTRVRYTGAAVSFNLAGLLGGGLAPIVATALSAGPGTPWGVAALVLVTAVASLVCVLLLPETTGPRHDLMDA